jgi:predicted MFS family arabinose efflux permease
LGGLVMSIVADVFPMERRGRAMATITLAFSFASVVGVPISLMLVDLFDGNWHVPFYLVAGLAVPFWILAWMYLPRLRDHLDSSKKFQPLETISYTFKNPAQRSALLFTILLVLGQFTIISMLAPFMISNVKLEQEEVKYMYLVGGLCTVVSSILIGKFVDKLGRFRIFQFFALVSIVPIFVNTHLSETPLWLVLILSGIFFIFVTGRMIPANTIISGVVNPKYRAGFMSLNSAAQSLASGASAAIAGMIVVQPDVNGPMYHYDTVGYVAISFTLLAILVMIRLKKIST